ncbi:MAG: hypothetical protein HRT67_04225 [Flavobacteriaceae bacterium]|nr:hypothetical protein [Flavobacteriaceae bacterium]
METPLNEDLLAEMHRYLNNELSSEECLIFEDKLSKNEILREALQLDAELSEVIGSTSNTTTFENKLNKDAVKTLVYKLRSEDYQQLSQHLKNAEKAYKNEQKLNSKKLFFKYIPVTAVVLLMLSIGFYMFQDSNSLHDYYNDYINWDELQSFAEKGTSETNFQKGELAFKNGNYDEAIHLFCKIPISDELYPFSLLYLGACYEKTNANYNAINTFKKLTTISSSQSNKGYWYMSLMYLKVEDKKNAVKSLQKVTTKDTNFKYKEAFQLLEAIKD